MLNTKFKHIFGGKVYACHMREDDGCPASSVVFNEIYILTTDNAYLTRHPSYLYTLWRIMHHQEPQLCAPTNKENQLKLVFLLACGVLPTDRSA